MDIDRLIQEYMLKCSLLDIKELKIKVDGDEVIAESCGQMGENVIIPSFVTKLAGYSFYAQEDLKTITLPKGLREIGNSAFYGCFSLEEVYIQADIPVIEPMVFAFCPNIKKITIESADIRLKSTVFHKCVSLNELNILGGTVKIDRGALDKFGSVYNKEHTEDENIYIKQVNIGCNKLLTDEEVFKYCQKIRAPKKFKEILIEYEDKLELY